MKGFKITKLTLMFIVCALMMLFVVSASAASSDWLNKDSTQGSTPALHEHIYTDWEVITEPKCNSTGKRIKTCVFKVGDATCGYVYEEEMPKNPDVHVGGTVTGAVEPTCSTEGKSTYKCSGCGKTVENHVAVVPHTFDETKWRIVEPKHTKSTVSDGYKSNRCLVCNENVKIIIPVTHTYNSQVEPAVIATCSTKGENLRFCTGCNKPQRVETDYDPDNHVYRGKALVIDGKVDCQNGGKGIVICEGCGETSYVDIKPEDAHDYLEWTYQAPTGDCKNADGYISKSCPNCSYSVKETWAAHELDEDAKTYASTCSDFGYSIGTCKNCKATKVKVIYELDEDAHLYNEVVLIEPTCESDGYAFRMCKYDSNHVAYESIPALGHKFFDAWEVTKAPTCWAEGEKVNTCIVCNEKVTESIPIDPDNHPSDIEWVVVEKATCRTVGKKRANCYACADNNFVEAEIPKHTGSLYVYSQKPATCRTEGEIIYACEDCSTKVKETLPIDPSAHKPGSTYYITEPATCSKTGLLSKVCSKCWTPIVATTGDYKQIVIEKKSHILSEWEIDEDYSCYEKGSRTRRCINQGCSYSETEKTKASHRYQSWVILKPATCIDKGLRQRGCNNCDYLSEPEEFLAPHIPGNWEFILGNCLSGGIVVKNCTVCKNTVEREAASANKHVDLVMTGVDYAVSNSICRQITYKCSCCDVNIKQITNHVLSPYSDVEDYAVAHEKCTDKDCKKLHKVIDDKNYHHLCTDKECTKYHKPSEPTCEDNGWTQKQYCMICKYIIEQEYISANGHDFEYDEEGTKYCLDCKNIYVETEDGGVVICDHFCHENGMIGKILTKVLTFFWKLLKINQECKCGLTHY